jgi:general secretion pathway protein D
MRRFALLVVGGLLAASAAFAGDDSSLTPPVTCNSEAPGGVNCIVTKEDRKEARNAFARGVKLEEHHHPEEALAEFEKASRLVPQDMHFIMVREALKSELVFKHIQRGNVLLAADSKVAAAAEFHAALDLDPDDQFASDRLREALRPPDAPRAGPVALADAVEIRLQPNQERADFHFSGDVRSLFAALGTAYGLTVQFDDSVKNRQVRFNVENVQFFTALQLACEISKSMWAALDSHQFLLAADTPENHKQFDRMSLQTFILPAHTTTQEVNDYILAMRNMFDLKNITSDLNANTVTVRAPQPILAACGHLLDQLRNDRPEVMLNLRIFEISHALTRNIGLHVPSTFNLYNIPAAALAGLGGQNIQQLINQLISSGGINQAGSTALSGLLAQLMGGANSIFSQPLATFGGGLTFMGLSLDQLAAQLSTNESWARTLSDVTLRTNQGTDANMHIGERYPILNATYAPIYNSPQISQVLGNNSYVPPFPSVSYEDIGLGFKAKPSIHSDNSVTLQLEMEVRSLTGDSSNGVPVISNKEFKGSITLGDGESAVIAGEISKSDTVSLTGLPGLGSLPLLNYIAAENTKEEDDDELMIVMTPHVVSNFTRSTPPIWISEK